MHKKLKLPKQNFKRALVQSSILLGCLALFFSSCSKSNPHSPLRLGHAKHFDIPQPVGFVLTPRSMGLHGDYFVCTGKQPLNKTIDFYAREMERSGWKIHNFSNAVEGLLSCSKPHKLCTVSIRADKNKTAVHTFVQQRDNHSSRQRRAVGEPGGKGKGPGSSPSPHGTFGTGMWSPGNPVTGQIGS
jgi:hypothetical protein